MTRVAVVGLGVMGGSLARALRRPGSKVSVAGWDRDPAQLAAAGAAGVLDLSAEGPAAVSAGAEIVVVATPLGALEDVLEAVAPSLEDEALVMDVASLQAPALDVAEAVDLARRYVSAHPLAGSEASGFAAARESLYDGVPVSLSVASSLAPDAADRLLLRSRWLWSEVGARPVMEDAGVHDARMALVSHLPQLVSNALARVLQTRGVEPGALGPGGMDMTRLAASSPEMWGDLLPYTGRRVGAALRALSAQAERLAAAVERGDMEPVEEIMQATRAWRRR